MNEFEPMPLRLGEPQVGLAITKMGVFDPDGEEVGLFMDDQVRNIYLVTIYGTPITVRSFRKDEVLEVAGLWLAYQKIKNS